jgi:hypothetical protein
MIAHRVYLIRNPWPELVPDNVLLQQFETAACCASDLWESWLAHGEIEEGRDSFAAVLLDPTRPRWAKTISDLVYTILVFGPNGERYIPNAASKADAHDRHGINMRDLVEQNILLADGEFAYGNSATVNRAIGGGSGLSTVQDGALVENILTNVTESVMLVRERFIEERRREHGNWRWFSANDTPNPMYVQVATLLDRAGTRTIEAGEPATSPR